MSQAVLISPAPIRTSHDLPDRLPADADFDKRWAAWQSRGRSLDRSSRRRFSVLAPAAAVAVAIGYLLLIR